MSKKLSPKMKKVLILIASLFTLACIVGYILYSNSYLVRDTLPPLPFTANSQPVFYGENIDISQVLPGSPYYVVNSKGQDLIDISADLGINLIRITNVHHSDTVSSEDEWNQVLGKMQQKGIKALILIDKNYNARDIPPAYLDLVQKYIDSGVFANSDVYGVDIMNEPLLTDASLNILQTAHAMIKAKYPDLKQTIGGWATSPSSQDPYNWVDFAAGQKIANIVDFYSIHMYAGIDSNNLGTGLNPDLRTKVFISQVQDGLRSQKPILIEEFGEANGDAVSDQSTVGSPELQAAIYQGVYQALKDMHSSQLLGAVAFDFYSRSQYPDAWAIVKNNGDYLFPAAYILQQYALGKNESPQPVSTAVSSQSYVVTNADNNSTETLAVSDRIGLKLQLDNSQNYSLSLSKDGVLQSIESFHYEKSRDLYFAVYQATKKGSLQLKITPDANCTVRDSVCTTPVYTLTINVQ